MDVSVERHGDVLLARLRESRLDATVAIRFKERMREVAAMPGGRIVLDMADVGFLDSSGLGAIVAVTRFLEQGRSLELARLSSSVERVFRLTRMDSVFAIHRDLPAALRDAG
jgi:anti-sigma B factor antagonist